MSCSCLLEIARRLPLSPSPSRNGAAIALRPGGTFFVASRLRREGGVDLLIRAMTTSLRHVLFLFVRNCTSPPFKPIPPAAMAQPLRYAERDMLREVTDAGGEDRLDLVAGDVLADEGAAALGVGHFTQYTTAGAADAFDGQK